MGVTCSILFLMTVPVIEIQIVGLEAGNRCFDERIICYLDS